MPLSAKQTRRRTLLRFGLPKGATKTDLIKAKRAGRLHLNSNPNQNRANDKYGRRILATDFLDTLHHHYEGGALRRQYEDPRLNWTNEIEKSKKKIENKKMTKEKREIELKKIQTLERLLSEWSAEKAIKKDRLALARKRLEAIRKLKPKLPK